MKKRTFVLGIVFLLAGSLANAATLTFAGFPGETGMVPNGYGGLDWLDVYYSNPDEIAECLIGVVSSQNGDFDFLSADLTSRYGENIILTVLGLNLDEARMFVTSGIPLSYGTWQEDYPFDFTDIDTLIFIAQDVTGGMAVLGLDNMEINPPVVPIPATLLLLGSGLLGLIGFRRTMRQ